jgi:polyphosphate glucokinase
MEKTKVLGVDVGASGIKGGVVDVTTGKLLTDRLRIETPSPATPKKMAATFVELIKMHKWKGLVGCGFPSIVKNGVAHSAANIDSSWKGTSIEKVFGKASGLKVKALNDADAAGLAEMRFGRGKGKKGTVIMITIGSGLGSAIFLNGKLLTNTELGHIYLKGQSNIAEKYASNGTKKKLGLDWEEWAERFNIYLQHVEHIFSPDLFILGGGASKKFEKYAELLYLNTPIIPAELMNNAGAIGAACYAYESLKK